MDRRTKENLLYVAEDLRERFGKRVVFSLIFIVLASGVFWGLQRVDAYLTPSYVKEREEAEEKAERQKYAAQAPYTIKEAYIHIPKIGLEAPIIFVGSEGPQDFVEPLKKGVAHYPSALPGEEGASILLGHSAPPGWFGNTFDGVFSDLKDLRQGDTVVVTTDGTRHVYVLTDSVILERGQDIPEAAKLSSESRLLLISCWPPGINNKRIMIQADKI